MIHTARIITVLLMGALILTAGCAGEPTATAASAVVTPTPSQEALSLPTDPPALASSPTPIESALVAQAQPTATDGPFTADGTPVIARVNGAPITRPYYERALERMSQQTLIADQSSLETMVLDMLIEEVLIEQAAADRGIVISDEQVEAEYQANRALAADDTVWQQWLDQNMYTDAEFRESIRATLIAGTMRDLVTADIGATVLHVQARHILLDSNTQATEIMNRLRGGEDFAALARQFSQDITTRDQGGDLGWFIDGELLEPALTQVAFAINAGQIAGPVVTRLGYHIIQTLGREERVVSDERRPVLAQIAFERWLQGLSFNAIIERY